MKWTSRPAASPWPEAAFPLLGAGLGLLALWRGGAGRLDGALVGRDWAAVLGMASFVERGAWGLYDPRSSLLHASLVAMLGERLGSYPNAALLLSDLGLLIGLSAALALAQRLGGPFAALLTGGSLFAGASLVQASHRLGPETLASGLLLGLLALTAAHLARPRPALAAAIGLVGALAFALDRRALLMAPFALAALIAPARSPAPSLGAAAMAALAAFRERRQLAQLRRLRARGGPPIEAPPASRVAPLRRAAILLGPALLGLLAGRLALGALIDAPPVEGLLGTLRHHGVVTLRADLLRLDEPRLTFACERLSGEAFLRPGFLLEPCAVEMAWQNLGHRLPPFVSGGGIAIFVGLLLCLGLPRPQPARRGGPLLWRLGMGLPVLLGAMLLPWSAGALVLAAPFAGLLLPIGLGRLQHRLGLGLAPATLAGFGLIGLSWGPLRAAPVEDPLDPAPNPERRLAQVAAALPTGGQYLDCSGQGLNFAFLPARVEEGPALPLAGLPLDLRTQDHCQRWMTEPPAGPALVSVVPRSDDLPQLPALLRGWSRLYEEPGWALYGR